MGNPVTWFDLGAADEGPLRAFYAELFGWKLERMAETYTMLSTGGGINGGIGHSQSGDPWLAFYVEVADPQAMLDKAVSLGGNIVLAVTEIPDVVTFAMFNDLRRGRSDDRSRGGRVGSRIDFISPNRASGWSQCRGK